MNKVLKKQLSVFTILFLFVSATYAQNNQISYTRENLCKALYSINIYSVDSLYAIQNYFKYSYFPKIVPTGANDKQFKNYLYQFQYEFGLKQTGTITVQTLNYLKKINSCYDLDKKIVDTQNAIVYKKSDLIDMAQNLMYSLFSQYVYSSTTPATIPSTTTTPTQSLATSTENILINDSVDDFALGTSTYQTNFCTGYKKKIYYEGQTVEDICDTVVYEIDHNKCIKNRTNKTPMKCTKNNWVKK